MITLFVSLRLCVLLLMREWESPSHIVYMPWHLGDLTYKKEKRKKETSNDIYNDDDFSKICPQSFRLQ